MWQPVFIFTVYSIAVDTASIAVMKFSKRQHVVEAEQDGGAADDDDDVRLNEFVTFFSSRCPKKPFD